MIVSGRVRTEHVRDRYLFCPYCYRRRPGEMLALEKATVLLGLIPLRKKFVATLLRCGVCWKEFNEDDGFPYDFGDHAEPKSWECNRCGEVNPGVVFRCQKCRKHV